MRHIVLILCAAALGGCVHGTQSLAPVSHFETHRYAGIWYEIARFPHSFERDLTAVTAQYTLQPDGSVRVENKGYNPKTHEWKSATARAYLKGDKTVGLLKVSFFRPFYATYKIIWLDTATYAHAVVTSDTYDYLWILSRSPQMSPAILQASIQFAKESGFDVSRLEQVDQSLNVSRQPEP